MNATGSPNWSSPFCRSSSESVRKSRSTDHSPVRKSSTVRVLVLLEDLLDVLGRRLVLEPDLVDERPLGARDRLGGDVGNAVRCLERLAQRLRPDSESWTIRYEAVRADEDDVRREASGPGAGARRSASRPAPTRGCSTARPRLTARLRGKRRSGRGRATTATSQAPSVSPGWRAAAVARRSVIDSVT